MKLFNSAVILSALCFLSLSNNALGKRIGKQEAIIQDKATKSDDQNDDRRLEEVEEDDGASYMNFYLGLRGFDLYLPTLPFRITITTGITEFFGYLACFSSHTTAEVKNKGSVPMSEISVGDEVLTSSGNYELVYAIDHRHPTRLSKFVQIKTEENAEQPLELTETHMLFLEGNESPIPASMVKRGDEVQTLTGPRKVETVSTITGKGIYNPLTKDGTIVASGIIASTYSAHFENSGDITIGQHTMMSHQHFFHVLLKPYKTFCTSTSLTLCKTKHEKVAVSEIAASIMYQYLSAETNNDGNLRNLLLSMLISTVLVVDVITNSYILGTAFAAATGWFVFLRKSKRES